MKFSLRVQGWRTTCTDMEWELEEKGRESDGKVSVQSRRSGV